MFILGANKTQKTHLSTKKKINSNPTKIIYLNAQVTTPYDAYGRNYKRLPPLPKESEMFFEKILFFKNYEKNYPSDPSGYTPDNIWNISDMF